MRTTISRRRESAAWAAVFWFLECALMPAGAWAQRRTDEPVANPQFQQQVQSGQASEPAGAPMAPASPAPPGAPTDAGPAPGGAGGGDSSPGGEEGYPPRGVQAVQIGPALSRRSAPDLPINPLETRIVVRVKNAPLATFLDTISAQAKVNFIITEGLEEKRVTAFLQNVTVREALQILLEIKGLTYQRIGKSNTYVVSPRSKDVPNRITRIYSLSFIPLVPLSSTAPDPSVRAQTTLLGTDASQGGGQGAAAGGQGFAAPPGVGGAIPQQGQPQQGGQAGLAGLTATEGPVAILNVMRSVLTRQYGSIAIDARTNSLIITDIPEVFPQVEQILAELDRKAPQVIIEAQIVEIDSNRSTQLGIEWGGANGQIGQFIGGARDTTFPLNLPRNLSNAHFFDPVNNVVSGVATNIAGGGGGSGGGSGSTSSSSNSGSSNLTANGLPVSSLIGNTLQTGVIDLTQLKVLLRALVARTEARFLGKPKVMTLNNKAAVIAITQSQAVASNQVQAGQQGLNTLSQNQERFTTGLILTVTPQINREGFITLLVEPKFTDVVSSVISSATQPVFDPVSRSAHTLVRVKNGQTLVMGGLLQSRENKNVRKVPFLGYIPLLGWLFTSTSTDRRNTDLVIFITPTVVND